MTPFANLIQSLVCWLVMGMVGWLTWRTQRVPDSVFRQAFWDYWPSILRGLIGQMLALVAGIFFFYQSSSGFVFLIAGFASWLVVYILMLERPHPGVIEKSVVSVLTLVIFAVVVFVDWHYTA